ncbi:ABC transporter ATP-binding protein [Microbacterium horticulturae]|uniref:ABC transporter ATP-binding protein n=1 Tax=Microbacterium horticulturae TaxID=3028316 RepID=A0ABY8C004_9MICO|nr:ABC transporter ATP-binding protein [Microbacterium sp. KACC 23027]WEG08565.1 ABC transporter ATP-binding protein [Microbacterium sp. KACC 23027]
MVISLHDVVVRLGEVDALRGATLDVDARTIAVIGENGSGKSTFARLLAGLVPAASGTVRVLGLDPARDVADLRRRVAVVFSNPDSQIVMPTVAEDVAFSLRPQRGRERLTKDAAAARVAAALARFGLTELAERPAHDLSGGQKQLLALAGAFIREPELVIADEPTAYLDARNARLVGDHLLADTGHRLVLATHDLALARRCDVAVLFADGRVRSTGTPADVVAEYEALLTC